MSVYLAPTFGIGWQGFTTAGLPLNAGKLYSYIAGGTTPQATYTTYLGNVQNSNPITLGADGRPPNEIWLTGGVSYRIDLKDSAGNLIKTYDNVSASSFVFTSDLASIVNPPGSDLVGVLRSDSLGATLTTILDGYAFLRGNQTPSAGGLMRIDLLRESSTFKLESLGSAWSANTYTYAGISKEFTASDGGASSPCAALTAYATDNASPADVLSLLAVTKAETSNASVFGANIIVTSKTGITTPVMRGLEIDMEPAAGVTPGAGSAGVYINVFNSACPGAAIQLGSASGGTFANGVLVGGLASTAAGFATTAGATMDSLINSTQGTYSNAAIVLANTHRIKLSGTASAHAYIFNDNANSLRIIGGSVATVIRNNADTITNWGFSDTGLATLSTTATINWDSNQSSGTATGGAATLPGNPRGFIIIQVGGAAKKFPYYDT